MSDAKERERENLIFEIRQFAEATKRVAMYEVVKDEKQTQSAKYDQERSWGRILELVAVRESDEGTVGWLLDVMSNDAEKKKEELAKIENQKPGTGTLMDWKRKKEEIERLQSMGVSIKNIAYDAKKAEEEK